MIFLTTAALVLMGLVSLLSAILDIQSAHTGPHGPFVLYFPSEGSRYLAAGYGAATLALAFGVYHRRLPAWRAGIAFLVVGWLFFAAQFLSANGLHSGTIVFGIASVFVPAFWDRVIESIVWLCGGRTKSKSGASILVAIAPAQ